MTIDDCFQLGYIIKPHGLDGSIDIFLDSDLPENYEKMESVFVCQHNQLVPFFITSIRLNGNKATINLEDVESKEEALKLKGCTLHLPLDMLPPLTGNAFYFHEIVDFNVVDKQLGNVGKVDKVYNYPGQDFIVVIVNGKEALIPINNEIIQLVDREAKIIRANLPDGLIDIYS